jgi:hypothetical protein
VLAAAAADCVGVALGPAVAEDVQPARRAIMMTNAARAGVSPIPRARRRAPAGAGGQWRVTGACLDEVSYPVSTGICGDINCPQLFRGGLLAFVSRRMVFVVVSVQVPARPAGTMCYALKGHGFCAGKDHQGRVAVLPGVVHRSCWAQAADSRW